MLEKPISNDFYEMGYDLEINRMYLRIKGFWKNREEVATYLQDIDDISSKLQSGYTLLTDLRQMKTPPVEMNSIHEEAQAILKRNGLRKTAELLQTKDLVLDTVMKRIAGNSGMFKGEFATMKEGEAWLDQG